MSDDPRELADSDTVSIGGDDITEPPLGPGDVVGERWQLDQYLSGGGMGTVWRALDLRLGEPAAVKLMRPQYASTDVLRQRFVREARAAAQVRGDNVVSIRDFAIDRASGVPYIAMELLRGEDLGRRLRRGPLGFLLTRSVLIDVCSAMARAHACGIVHRDLKPANIFLVPVDDGFSCKVLDFGIAKLAPDPASLTDTGSTLGTVSYMSPEQITDAKHVDHRADLWAIAVIAYECLVGRPAFVGRNMAEIVHKICYGEWDPPSSVAASPYRTSWRLTLDDGGERSVRAVKKSLVLVIEHEPPESQCCAPPQNGLPSSQRRPLTTSATQTPASQRGSRHSLPSSQPLRPLSAHASEAAQLAQPHASMRLIAARSVPARWPTTTRPSAAPGSMSPPMSPRMWWTTASPHFSRW